MALKRRPPQNNVRRAKTNSQNSWGVMTNQLGETTQYESDKEKIMAYKLKRDPNVARFISQPFVIHFVDDQGKKHQYTPDYEVHFKDGRVEIQEFSLTKRRKELSIQRREEAAKKYCVNKGWTYRVLTEQDLPSLTEIANLRTLHGYSPTSYYQHAVAEKILSKLEDGLNVNILDLSTQIALELDMPQALVHNTLFHMIWHALVAFDPNVLLFIDGTPNRKAKVWNKGS